MLKNTLSIHRPGWTQDDREAFRHLHLPVRRGGKVVASINKFHFDRTKGFSSKRDLINPSQPLHR